MKLLPIMIVCSLVITVLALRGMGRQGEDVALLYYYGKMKVSEKINLIIYFWLQRVLFQRSPIYDMSRGFGSDGYLYDFVKKNQTGCKNCYRNGKNMPEIILPRLRPLILQKPRSDLWRGFGSDGYLHDFVEE